MLDDFDVDTAVVLLVFVAIASLGSTWGVEMAHGMYDVADFEQLTSLSSSTALPFTGITGDCIGVRLQAETQNVRMRTDDTAPTSSVGEILYATDPPTEYFGDLSKLRFIEATASAKLNVTYYRAKRPEHVGN